MEELKGLLERLSNAHGLSGFEGDIRDLIREELESFVDEIRVDTMGNIVATKKGDKPSVMVAAHMDEIGLMCKYIDEKGFLRFVKIGGWFDQSLHSQRVVVHGEKGRLYGVIGAKPPHVIKEEERKKLIKAEDMFVDIGAKSREEAEALGVKVGTPITLDREFRSLAGGLVTGKAFDDRAGVCVMIQVMKQLSEIDTTSTVYAVGTVQEEVGLKGAKTSAFDITPDVAIATDVTITGDHPGIEKKDAAIEMGKGTVITVVDAAGRGLITHPKVLQWLEETAKQSKIPYQLDVADGGTTDGTAIHLTKSGIPTGVVSVPSRYIHSPVETLSLHDLKASVDLITRAITTVDKYF
jgi:endoglucanase